MFLISGFLSVEDFYKFNNINVEVELIYFCYKGFQSSYTTMSENLRQYCTVRKQLSITCVLNRAGASRGAGGGTPPRGPVFVEKRREKDPFLCFHI